MSSSIPVRMTGERPGPPGRACWCLLPVRSLAMNGDALRRRLARSPSPHPAVFFASPALSRSLCGYPGQAQGGERCLDQRPATGTLGTSR